EHYSDQLTFVFPKAMYRQVLLQLFHKHVPDVKSFPAMLPFDDWVNQLLGLEPTSYLVKQHLFLQALNRVNDDKLHEMLRQRQVQDDCFMFFMSLLNNGIKFENFSDIFPTYYADLEQQLRSLFVCFKQLYCEQFGDDPFGFKQQRLNLKKDSLKHVLFDHTIVFFGFTGLTFFQKMVIQQVSHCTANMSFYGCLDDGLSRWLTHQGVVPIVDQSPSDSYQRQVSLYVFDDIALECRWIIKTVLGLLQEQPEQVIQLVLPTQVTYRRQMQQLADEYELSFAQLERQPFSQSTLAECCLSLIDFMESGFSSQALITLLSSPLIQKVTVLNDNLYIDVEMVLQCVRSECDTVNMSKV
ncbi:hypothetical protein DID76_03625, partial [Candidatus Marinamargulisbacteria bacterium SCGC AG-414-C22]